MAAIYDSSFHQIARVRKKTKGHEGEKIGVSRIVATVQEAASGAGVNLAEVGGIGIGCPGPVDTARGVILEAVNLGWRKAKLQAQLESEFGRPVVVVNDVDAGVYGEFRFGAAKSARTVLGVFPGTGIGGGGVYEGQIVHGKSISCMEIGHIPVVPEGARCGCGLRGCLETIASRLAISAEAAKAAFRGEAPFLMKQVGTDVSAIRSGVLARAIENGDKVVEDIVRRAAGYLGKAVATVVHLMAPDTIVLGGGMVEAMPGLFQKVVSETATSHVMSVYASSFKVVTAKLGDDAAVIGAAAWAQRVYATDGIPSEESKPR